MIAYIEGTILHVSSDSIIILVTGLGYEVVVIDCAPTVGEQVALYIYDLVREDRHELYGFVHLKTKALFEALIAISGVGPKLAEKILRFGSPEHLQERLLSGDIEFLTSIPGVGKKTAQKIILELKGVLVDDEQESSQNTDTIDALMSLGYSRRDVLPIISHLSAQSPEDRIREALKFLSHGS